MAIGVELDRIKQTVGPTGWIADPQDQEPYLVESRRLYRGATRLVVRPAPTEEVAAVVRICAEAGLAIVPQGGNTGLVGGGVPPEDRDNIVLALGRMNRIRAIDPNQLHDDGRGRLHPRQSAPGGGRGGPAVPAEPRRRGQLPDRRQSVDQCRRDRGLALRQHPRADFGHRGGAARRPRLERAQGAAQGQHRLRSETAVHRRRGHARHHHRGDDQTVPEAARGRDRLFGAGADRGCDEPLRPCPRRQRRSIDRVRADPARRPRSGTGAYRRHDRPAGRGITPGMCS